MIDDELTSHYKEAVLMASDFADLMSLYETAAEILENKLRYLSGFYRMIGVRNPIDNIQSRIKSPESILGKMERLQVPFTLDNMRHNLNDIAGIRVICHFMTDVYHVKEILEKQEGVEIIKVKDYIKNPKPNGYRSLHLIVLVTVQLEENVWKIPVEVQLRTIAMNFWASCEHQLRYKKGYELNDEQMTKLKDCADRIHEMDQTLQGLADEILGSEQ